MTHTGQAKPKSPGSHPLPLRVLPNVTDADTTTDEIHRSHTRIAYRLAAAATGKLLHVPNLGWYYWTGRHWEIDAGERVARRGVVEVIKRARAEAAGLNDKQARSDLWADAKQCETAAGVRGVLELGTAMIGLSALADELDNDPYLLNTLSGTLDLRTAELREADPDDRVTKVTGCGYDPSATSADWDAFLTAVLPDAELRRFLQCLIGLALVGKVIEHILPILTGTGRNGKGTFVRVVGAALGPYAIEAEPDIFMARDRAHPTGQLDLRGTRLATCQETDDGRRMDVAAVKRLTGGDTIRARRMRQDFIEFRPSHLPVLITNHLPKVPADDPALWARLLVIPFEQSFLGREDRGLEDRLCGDLEAVLAWAVRGWTDYQANGLQVPPGVAAATTDYRTSADTLAQFLEDRCVVNQHTHVGSGELWAAWERWSYANGAEPGTNRIFKAMLESHGYALRRTTAGVRVSGIGLASAVGEDT
jgi:putative DNA primase/helicase